MNILRSVFIAISMYSVLPVPKVEWNEKNMRYCMNAFPIVGLIIGFFMWLFHLFTLRFSLPSLLAAVGYTLIPIAVTGGIHLDGYMDTVDALASHKSPEEKRRILKDPNVGAFSVIHLVCILLLLVALWYSLPAERFDPVLITLGFVFSRCLSGLSVLTFPKAEGSGLAATFSEAAGASGGEIRGDGNSDGNNGNCTDTNNQKGGFRVAERIQIVECLAAAVLLCVKGRAGIAILITSVIIYLWYKRISRKEFGGLNGDQAGWFLTITEVWITVVIIVINTAF
ncbi:MAG: adenosylcobinamide-GDP ribazoletransferase [Lachnospiraceae bacterium]|nr:adenosylcobinamide-GDP ribazoletransferase [Lachnospiraceae bacterium]